MKKCSPLMRIFELNRKERLGEEEYPIQAYQAHLSLAIDFGDNDVPPAAQRRLAHRILRLLANETTENDLRFQHADNAVDDARAPPTPGTTDWQKPDELDLRVIKSAHRIIQEVARRGERGRAVLASELIADAHLSAPTVGRLLRPGEPAHEYLRRYIHVTPEGRTKALDLTPEGRMLASRIRAGSVPV